MQNLVYFTDEMKSHMYLVSHVWKNLSHYIHLSSLPPLETNKCITLSYFINLIIANLYILVCVQLSCMICRSSRTQQLLKSVTFPKDSVSLRQYNTDSSTYLSPMTYVSTASLRLLFWLVAFCSVPQICPVSKSKIIISTFKRVSCGIARFTLPTLILCFNTHYHCHVSLAFLLQTQNVFVQQYIHQIHCINHYLHIRLHKQYNTWSLFSWTLNPQWWRLEYCHSQGFQ